MWAKLDMRILQRLALNDNMTNLDNDSDSSITWDNVVAMEEAARDLEEAPASAPIPSWRER